MVESTDLGYLFSWNLGEPTTINLGGFDPDYADLSVSELGPASELLEDMTFEIETDECGFYLSLKNWEDIGADVRTILETLAARPGTDFDISEEELDSLMDAMTTQPVIETVVADEIIIFYDPFGYPYDQGEPEFFDALVPNPFGGEPLPATGYFGLDTFDARSQCGVFVTEYTYEGEPTIENLVGSLFDLFPCRRSC